MPRSKGRDSRENRKAKNKRLAEARAAAKSGTTLRVNVPLTSASVGASVEAQLRGVLAGPSSFMFFCHHNVYWKGCTTCSKPVRRPHGG
jgi:hypothetical protein